MAGEVMLINPRRRRRRTRKAKSSHRRKSRRRRRHTFAMNPRRRRRRAGRRRSHARRRRHSNPRLGLGSLTSGLNTGLGIGIGVVATEVGTAAAVKFIPGIPAQLQSGLGLSALKLGVGAFALPFVVGNLLKQRTLARNIQIGAWVSVIVDALHTYVTPHLGLSDYTMSDYTSTMGDGAPEEIGAAENMYGDTMYGYGA